MSYYALFKRWLLLSQPPGCLGDRTSFDTEPALGGLSRRSGLFPFRPWSLSPTVSLLRHRWNGIRSLIGFGRLTPPSPFRALPPSLSLKAAPQCISGRTSYLRVRLAFHLYPQLIPSFCTSHEFGPPVRVIEPSTWPWVAHPVSGLIHGTKRPVQTRFRCGSRTPVP